MAKSVWVQLSLTSPGWKVHVDGRKKAIGSYDRQTDAVKAARNAAREIKAELYVCGRNGQIRFKNSYGNDPRKVRG